MADARMRSHTLPRKSGELPVIRCGLLLSFGVIGFDQLTKYWVVHKVMSPPQVIEVTSFFNLVMVWNTGASFGLFSSQSLWTQVILVGLAIFFSIFLIVWLRRTRSVWLSIALGLIIGGALGNAIDRVVYSAVADFLDFHAFDYHWPSFNVADIAISIGVILLLIDGFTGRRGKHKFKSSLDSK